MRERRCLAARIRHPISLAAFGLSRDGDAVTRHCEGTKQVCYAQPYSGADDAPAFYLIAILLISALAAPIRAATRDPDLPRLDGKNEWHTIAPTAKTTQSKCIGQTTTPACAIETYEACIVRYDDRLCKIASGPFKPFAPDKIFFRRPSPEQYRINRSFRIDRANVPSYEIDAKHHLRQIGDIEVEIKFRRCDPLDCDPYGDDWSTYLLRRTNDGWNVVGNIECAAADIGHASGGSCSNYWPYSPAP